MLVRSVAGGVVESAGIDLLLVHGAWGSPEMWRFVVEGLGDVEYRLALADLPTTNRADATFDDDVAHVRALARGSKVVLCGHSYGGQVITAAGCDLPGIAHLVYLATLALDVGETMGDWMMKRPGSTSLQLTTFDDGTDVPQGWGEDDGRYTPDALARIRSLRLRPMAGGPSPPVRRAAWREVPSTFIVATADSLIHPDIQRETAARAGSRLIEIDTEHMVNLAAPGLVAAALASVMGELMYG
jgi:pimeloyl-ACP methyl ester carboxylesterase